MKPLNCDTKDLSTIQLLYQNARELMQSKNQVVWPKFSSDLIEREIVEKRQWKILIGNEIACVWAITFNDELIWGSENDQPSLYIHRIATNPNFRGQNLVNKIVQWSDEYCLKNDLDFVRLDTVGHNQGLIDHYVKHGFDFLGTKELENTDGLPAHYNDGPVCLFQRSPKNQP